MKKLSLLSSLVFSSLLALSPVVKAELTLADADAVFAKRELDAEGLSQALKSADLYHQLFEAAKAADKGLVEQAELLVKEAEAMYFYADNSADAEIKKSGHLRGWEKAEQAAKLLVKKDQPTTLLDPSYSRAAAQGYYWMGANMGKWGLANGILNSLRRWPELRQTMEYIQTLGENDVEYYGPNRVLARSYSKLPFPLGDKSKALELMEEANQMTMHDDGDISNHSTNVLYYAEILIAKDEVAKAKTLLQTLIAKGQDAATLKAYNEERVPETKADIEEAKRVLSRI